MRLDFFIIAEAANAVDGKLYIHGGALSNIAPTKLPWVHPQLALVLRIEVLPEDEGHDHELSIRLCGPTGDDVVPAITVPLTASGIPERLPGRPIHLNAALTVGTIPFSELGDYTFVVSIDGDPAGTEHLFIIEPDTST